VISDFSDIASLFTELDGSLKKNVDAFLIGGGALMKYGLRDRAQHSIKYSRGCRIRNKHILIEIMAEGVLHYVRTSKYLLRDVCSN
jgi:hypothetical protein